MERKEVMKEYKISVKLVTMDMYRFLMKHEYGAFSGLFGLAMSILALAALVLGVGEGDRNTQILLVLLASCFTVLNPIRLFLRAQKQISMNPTFHEPIEYTFGEEGMHIAQGEVQMDVPWSDMKKLVRGRKIMVLYLSRVVGYIFPRSQCAGHFEEIAAMIELKMAQAKSAGQNAADSESADKTEAGNETDKEAARKLGEAMRKASLARGTEGSGKGKRKYDMPPGEAEIWGDDDSE